MPAKPGLIHAVSVTLALILTACGPYGTMPAEPRRIVTAAVDDNNVVIADGHSTNVLELNGSQITRLWETGPVPVSLNVTRDLGADAGNAYRQGFVGSSLYVADIPPGSDLSDIPLHSQQSLDYIVVLEGEIDMVLPDESIRMRQGDILIQAATVHSWVNPTDEYCRLLVVVLTGASE